MEDICTENCPRNIILLLANNKYNKQNRCLKQTLVMCIYITKKRMEKVISILHDNEYLGKRYMGNWPNMSHVKCLSILRLVSRDICLCVNLCISRAVEITSKVLEYKLYRYSDMFDTRGYGLPKYMAITQNRTLYFVNPYTMKSHIICGTDTIITELLQMTKLQELLK